MGKEMFMLVNHALKLDFFQEQVQTNKDLDLPTQQELLAQFRCDEISSVTLAEFTEQLKSQLRPIEAGHVVESLGSLMRNWRSQAFGEDVVHYLTCTHSHTFHRPLRPRCISLSSRGVQAQAR